MESHPINTAATVSAARVQQGNSALSVPIPLSQAIGNYPFQFSGSGSEYFRIWIVNLLLILVTLGLYLPWAKVRKLKYFYNNTRIAGHTLDFHGDPKKMLRGLLLTGFLFGLYSQAAQISAITGLVGAVVLLALAPLLFRAAMKFRLANTSWHGLRFRFTATDLKELYWRLVPPLALILLPGTLVSFLKPPQSEADTENLSSLMSATSGVIGLCYLILIFSMPYFFWRLKRFQHNHYAWGPLISEYRSSVMETYKVFGMTALVMLGIVATFGVAAALLIPTLFFGGKAGLSYSMFLILIPLFYAFAIAINIAPRAYFTSRMQNLLWSRTGNSYFRFKSELPAQQFMWLQFKNYFLIFVTVGLYWPFAVIATKRMQLEAMALKARADIENLVDAARKREDDGAGDMAVDLAGDFLGIDIGM